VKRRPQAAGDLHATLENLSKDAFHPQLRTHKLKGKLAGKQRTIDESIKFWESALKYVKSNEYTPETYNARFGDVPFAWCRYMESIDGGCNECEFYHDEWCGHAPFINKLQPETSNCMSEDVDLDEMAKVTEAVKITQPLHVLGRQPDPVALGQLKQRGWADTALQVDVQLNLGQTAGEFV